MLGAMPWYAFKLSFEPKSLAGFRFAGFWTKVAPPAFGNGVKESALPSVGFLSPLDSYYCDF